MGTDRDWEKWGSDDPYYGVLSTEKYRAQNISEQDIEDFFESGKHHVDMVFETILRVFETDLSPERTLDFGCGVGRLIVPFACKSYNVVGIDTSPSMLAEAQRNCSRFNVNNCKFVLSDDRLSKVDGRFDLVHSALVLQHIPSRRGLRIVRELLGRVDPGGFAALQFLYRCNVPTILRAIVKLRYIFPPANYARNLYRRRPAFEPPMQLHDYDLSRILHCMSQLGFRDIHILLESQADGQYGSSFVFARRENTA